MKAAALIAALVGLTAPAYADRIAIEAYTGARPAEADAQVAPVLAELARRGVVSRYDDVGARVAGAPTATAAGLPADFGDQIERGHKAWIKGQFNDAIAQLTPLVDLAHANPLAVAQTPRLRDAVERALVAIALSEQRLGNHAAASATMAEVVRAFPDAPLTLATHGPEAFGLYQDTAGALARGVGSLIVKVSDPKVSVYLDERFEKVGNVSRADLVAGDYRVFGLRGTQAGRAYTVHVDPGQDATLTLDWPLDLATHTGVDWTGFAFARASDRDGEVAAAAHLAQSLGATEITVVGLDTVRGRPAVVGATIDATTARVLRRAAVAVATPPNTTALIALAGFLTGDPAGVDVLDASGDVDHGARAGSSAARPGRGPWPYLALGATVAAVGVGAYLVHLDGSCSATLTQAGDCPRLYDTAVPGWATLGGAAVLAGVTGYLFLRHPGAPARTVAVVPTGGGALAVVTASF